MYICKKQKHIIDVSQENKSNLSYIHYLEKMMLNKDYLNIGTLTSDYSLLVKDKYSFEEIPNYNNGDWWVQDFSSMLPISMINTKKYNKISKIKFFKEVFLDKN